MPKAFRVTLRTNIFTHNIVIDSTNACLLCFSTMKCRMASMWKCTNRYVTNDIFDNILLICFTTFKLCEDN